MDRQDYDARVAGIRSLISTHNTLLDRTLPGEQAVLDAVRTAITARAEILAFALHDLAKQAGANNYSAEHVYAALGHFHYDGGTVDKPFADVENLCNLYWEVEKINEKINEDLATPAEPGAQVVEAVAENIITSLESYLK